MLVGAWSVLPPYTGPELGVPPSVEVVDHVVPGAMVLAVAAACLAGARRAEAPTGAMLVAGLAIALAGLWMTATHLPLLAQAMRRGAPLAAALYHSVPALVVLGLGLIWALSYRRVVG